MSAVEDKYKSKALPTLFEKKKPLNLAKEQQEREKKKGKVAMKRKENLWLSFAPNTWSCGYCTLTKLAVNAPLIAARKSFWSILNLTLCFLVPVPVHFRALLLSCVIQEGILL